MHAALDEGHQSLGSVGLQGWELGDLHDLALWVQGSTSLLGSEVPPIAPSPHIPQRETRRDLRLNVPNEERELCHRFLRRMLRVARAPPPSGTDAQVFPPSLAPDGGTLPCANPQHHLTQDLEHLAFGSGRRTGSTLSRKKGRDRETFVVSLGVLSY